MAAQLAGAAVEACPGPAVIYRVPPVLAAALDTGTALAGCAGSPKQSCAGTSAVPARGALQPALHTGRAPGSSRRLLDFRSEELFF